VRPATAVLVFLWGAVFGPVSVVWSAWVTRGVPEHAETAGGIFIAAIQLSAALAAMAGGVVFDRAGSSGVFTLSAAAYVLSAVIVGIWVTSRTS
jgi:predicted MFS family arabinose efflux permease